MNPEDQKSESLSSVVERITVSLDSMSKGQKYPGKLRNSCLYDGRKTR